MQLSHVYKWNDNHGWEQTTAEHERQICSRWTVSARSEIFMCGLCGQYVTFTQEGKVERHFRHSSREADKSCPERTFSDGGESQATFKVRDYSLPLRLRISPEHFKTEIGFMPLSQEQLECYRQEKLEIEASSPEGSLTFSYLIGDRIGTRVTTYLSVGDVPSTEYRLRLSEKAKILEKFWPVFVDGIHEDGTLFGSVSYSYDDKMIVCKKLPDWSDIQVNESYILLSKKEQHCFNFNDAGINLEGAGKIGQWYVYKIKAMELSVRAAKFFLDRFYYKYLLQEHSVQMYPIWPVCVEISHMIFHNSSRILIFLQGDVELQRDDSGKVSCLHTKSSSKLFDMECSGRQQIVAAGRNRVLRYAYLRKDSLERYQATQPIVEVRNHQGSFLTCDEYHQLPEKKELNVTAPYDGSIVIRRGQKITEKYELKANVPFQLRPVQFGQRIEVYQGLDLVWSVSFESEENDGQDKERTMETWDEDVLLRRLYRCRGTKITVAHSLGAIGTRLKHYPKVRQWLYRSMREGSLSRRALQVLRAIAEGVEKCQV